jgi:hypothetical protein
VDDELQAKLAKLNATIRQANADKRDQRETDRERVRRLLASEAPEVLAWLDLVRGRFGPGVQLERLTCGDETFPKKGSNAPKTGTTSTAAAASAATSKQGRGG